MAETWTLQLMLCAGSGRTLALTFDGEDEARAALRRIVASPVQAEFPALQEADARGVEIVVFGGGPLEAVVLHRGGLPK